MSIPVINGLGSTWLDSRAPKIFGLTTLSRIEAALMQNAANAGTRAGESRATMGAT